MNYQKIYNDLIFKRKQYPANKEFSYSETHHIIPRSLDKSKEKDPNNLVSLSAREHFIAHALLVKIYKHMNDKNKWYRMLCAFDAMSKLYGSNKYPDLRYKNKCNSKLYEIWKVELSNYIKETGCRAGENASNYGTHAYYNPLTKEVKYFKKDTIIPDGWVKGLPPWLELKGSIDKVWLHNSITNKQIYVNKDKVEQYLIDHPEYKKGMSPTAKTHVQYFNPSKGKYWITNLELKISKRIDKNEELPDGWLIGRISDFDKYLEKYFDAYDKKLKYHFINYKEDIKNKFVPRILKNKRKLKSENKNAQKYVLSDLDTKEEKISLLKKYFNEYKLNGYKGVVQKFSYPHSRQALIKGFKKFLPIEYKEYEELKYL